MEAEWKDEKKRTKTRREEDGNGRLLLVLPLKLRRGEQISYREEKEAGKTPLRRNETLSLSLSFWLCSQLVKEGC